MHPVKLILKGKGGDQHYVFFYHFVDLDQGVALFFELWKRGDNRIREHWLWSGYWHLLHSYIEGGRVFHAEPLCFFIVFWWKKTVAFKNSLELYFYHLIIEATWFAQLQFRTEENIYTKTVVEKSRGGVGGANNITGRVSQGGTGSRRKSWVLQQLIFKRWALWTFTLTLWPLFMDGIQLSQGYRVTMMRQFTFNHYFAKWPLIG